MGDSLKSWLQEPKASSQVTVKVDKMRLEATMTNTMMIDDHTVRGIVPVGREGDDIVHVDVL